MIKGAIQALVLWNALERLRKPENFVLAGRGERVVKEYTRNDCPLCGMKLKKINKAPRMYLCKCGFRHIGKLSLIDRCIDRPGEKGGVI